jgi:hypothetical protein
MQIRGSYTNHIAFPVEFLTQAVTLCQASSRSLCIQSPHLDHEVFNQPELAEAISAFARGSRHSEIRILISDNRPLLQRGHRLLQLARRIPSAMHFRVLPEHPNWKGESLVIGDRNAYLFQPQNKGRTAFGDSDARADTLKYLERFNELWRAAQQDSNLRALSL